MQHKAFCTAMAAALIVLGQQATAADMDFHGYFRSGGGSSNKGGKEACFRLPGASMGFFRLGNECDTYASLDFGANLGKTANGIGFRVVANVAYGTQQINNWEQSTPAWRQVYAEASDIGNGALEKAKLWVGKRFYKNPDVHMLDYTWWEPANGPGAGIDGIELGPGKLAYAVLRQGDTDWNANSSLGDYRPGIVNGGKRAVTNHDLRWQDIETNPNGRLTIGANFVKSNNRDGEAGKNGITLTLNHVQHDPFGWGGFNSFIVQAARGAANLNGSGTVGYTGSHRGWRAIEYLVIEPKNTAFTGSFVAAYESDGEPGKTNKMFTIGGRPQYHFDDAYSVAFEIGMQQLKPGDSGPTRRLSKFTIAPQLSMGRSIWSRPALRLYYTYATWNDAAKQAGPVVCTGRDCATDTLSFANNNNGSSYGAQVEAWW
ncbi:carbohydrate porin [Chitinivorax sp. B]|uniref:maltoporin n=1 Tax=Chitinivorax sp. B TaxID=2502235 RepID=UPI0010F626EA|nr:carbohydrate porin [Chitinivorax sp. B]